MKPSSKILAAGSVITAAGMMLGSWAPLEFRPANFSDVLKAYLHAGQAWPSSRTDTVANTALSLPFAFVFTGFLFSLKDTLGWRIIASLLALIATAIVSLACELPQGWLEHRFPSIHDTFAQMLGAAVGCSLWWLVGPTCQRSLDQMVAASEPALRVQAGLSLAVLIVLIWSILPGRVLLSPADYGQKWAKGRIELVPFTLPITSMSDVFQLGWCALIGVPLGLWSAHLVRVFFRRRPSLASQFLVIFALGALPEILQIPIATRYASATDALFTMLGVAIGYFAARRLWAKHDARVSDQMAGRHHRSMVGDPALWFAIALVYWILTCLLSWYPFEFITDPVEVRAILSEAWKVPVADYRGSNLRLLFSVLRATMLAGVGGLLLGVAAGLIASVPLRRVAVGGLVVGVVVIALGIELGQLLERSHTGGGIGVLSRVTGGWIGLAVGRALVGSGTNAELASHKLVRSELA